MRRLEGAYSVAMIFRDKLVAFRDPHGFRPLSIGEVEGGYAVSSETCGLDIIGAKFLRDVEPGEVVVIDDDGLTSYRAESPRRALCVFEYVYFARPDSRFDGREVAGSRHRLGEGPAGAGPGARFGGREVAGSRHRMGERLAEEAPVEADVVIPVPDSGMMAAVGFSQRSGIPYAEGLIKNRYVGRTFIQPSNGMRQLGIRLKLNPLPSVIEGNRVVVVDDSIVRGNTSRKLVELLFEAGAAEVHVRVSSPPVKGPCYYGIDMDSPDQLAGANYTVEEITAQIGATPPAHLSTPAPAPPAPRPARPGQRQAPPGAARRRQLHGGGDKGPDRGHHPRLPLYQGHG